MLILIVCCKQMYCCVAIPPCDPLKIKQSNETLVFLIICPLCVSSQGQLSFKGCTKTDDIIKDVIQNCANMTI